MCGYFKPDMDDFAQQAPGTNGPFLKPGITVERKPSVLCFLQAAAEKWPMQCCVEVFDTETQRQYEPQEVFAVYLFKVKD